ncbi:MAG: non-hydrolyzing UDP-N-acetylglucosamine 2-epimerase [Pseudomonadota bacterium]
MALIFLVAGARPNFMKIAPIVRALEERSDRFRYRIVHTGQHFDHEMSDVFFEELGIPTPDYHLGCGGGSHAQQTAKIMVAFEETCQKERPDCVLVVGDVNSTLACSIVAKKMGIRVAHVEAGLRSGDMSMPEEINRLVTDSISDWFFVTEPSGYENLIKEGKSPDVVFDVGHVMIDNLLYQHKKLEQTDKSQFISEPIKKQLGRYGVVTLHRPSNVDDAVVFLRIMTALNTVAESISLVFPVHPRTRQMIEKCGITPHQNILLTKPLSYMDFLNLWKDAVVVMTDSGGLQEETTGLGVPCLTLRENTERPVTVEQGSNVLVGTSTHMIVDAAFMTLVGGGKTGRRPALWDGAASRRIVGRLSDLFSQC